MKRYLLSILILMGLFFYSTAFAHWADLAAAEISVNDKTVTLVLTFPTGLVADFDDDANGQLSSLELKHHHLELESYFKDHLSVNSSRETAQVRLEPSTQNTPGNLGLGTGSHTTLTLKYIFNQAPDKLSLHYGLFLPGVSTASCLATILNGRKTDTFVFTPESPNLNLASARVSFWHTLKSFVALGIEHIWTGYDHLLFLLTLFMLGGGLAYLLKVASAFTLAHSVTLSLAVLGLVSLPGRLVESGIALSIAYVAAENLVRDKESAARRRWLLTFFFGLINGLGFASILREMAIPRQSLATALISFNLGVEFGQLVIVALAFGLFALIKRWRYEARLRWALSAFAVVMGMIWFVERAFVI
ncbi:MAG: HupE/UreJ family protein [Trueperaceae bacterium]|nr:HupE/UreJ family protein [Trueperaceae bacterium]